eukprot:CAMPEP_0198123416 /NCGR_PEP_ID=MMETSP1442-20131203/37484_1 /TAXON_ID= /ORGANISM="Craspedostauros australis, Strain CCMP3328" /LENGTH=77 /DNA_ID=CAMNT_0043782619 /DNA_START=95 /DNA_END=325 /DNA_ORIENTATION=-
MDRCFSCPELYHSGSEPSMCFMDFRMPSKAISTRSSALFASSSLGRISSATPMAGSGLTKAPIQKAQSVGDLDGDGM